MEREAVGLPTHRLSHANQQPIVVADDVVDGSSDQVAYVVSGKTQGVKAVRKAHTASRVDGEERKIAGEAAGGWYRERVSHRTLPDQ